MFKRGKLPFFILILVSLIIRIHDIFITDLHVWDGSTYVGIGKWFFSHGQVGYFETFRPIILPIFEGIFWKLHIDTLVGGSVVAMLASLAIITLVYVIGERMQKSAGLISAVLLSFTPVFLLYSHITMSDVFSTAFMLLGLLFVTRERYFLAGLFVGLGMLTRFPQGLATLVLGLTVVIMHYRAYRFAKIGLFTKRALMTLLGFALITAPYFIWTGHLFGDPLLPMKEGNAIIAFSPHVYHRGNWFYFKTLFINNPFLGFSLIGLGYVALDIIRKRTVSVQAIMFSLGLIIYGTYFTLAQPHKELRYSLPWLPFVAGLSGYALGRIFTRARVGRVGTYVVLLVGAIALSVGYYKTTDLTFSSIRTEYYAYFDSAPYGTKVIATEPMSYGRGDTKLLAPMYGSWADAFEKYTKEKANADYVSVDSCVLESACSVDAHCLDGKAEMMADLEQHATKVFYGEEPQCTLSIYKLK